MSLLSEATRSFVTFARAVCGVHSDVLCILAETLQINHFSANDQLIVWQILLRILEIRSLEIGL